ncbi:MAG: CvpA family protein [Caryophanon sp.]|nr:CvpA family protein [Caryophanon sp.]
MIDLFILIALVAGAIVGMRRGLLVQSIHLVGVIAALIVAGAFYRPLAKSFEMLIPYPGVSNGMVLIIPTEGMDVDRTFYRMFAYVLIFIVAKLVIQVLASAFNKYAYLPLFKNWNRLIGAVLAIVEVYIVLYMVLNVLAMLPLQSMIDRLDGSLFTSVIVNSSPILSMIFEKMWYLYI